jgi:glycosyltransferase involved in cell wall biosynthesis
VNAKIVVRLVYASPEGISGQRDASILLGRLLKPEAEIHEHPLPAGRGKWSAPWALLLAMAKWLWQLFRCFEHLDWEEGAVHINLGQTPLSMLREGAFIFAGRALGENKKILVALHGSSFTLWRHGFKCVILREILNASSRVIVLGDVHRNKLIGIGVKTPIEVIDNFVPNPEMTRDEIQKKHETNEKAKILYLSSLIESKGYKEFVEAVAAISAHPRYAASFSAIVCGRLNSNVESSLFSSEEAAREWILSKVRSLGGSIRWIEGCYGKEKTALLKEAHILVLPTYYSVEAQPLVILEALAFGCAVITTTAGVIGSTVSVNEAIFVTPRSADAIEVNLRRLITDKNLRCQLALKGRLLYEKKYCPSVLRENWLRLLVRSENTKGVMV